MIYSWSSTQLLTNTGINKVPRWSIPTYCSTYLLTPMCAILNTGGRCQLNLSCSWTFTSSLRYETIQQISIKAILRGIKHTLDRNEVQLTRKWTSNQPPKPENFVSSPKIDEEKLVSIVRISSTVAVKQSISLIIAAVPMTWSGLRLFHNEVWNYKCSLSANYDS